MSKRRLVLKFELQVASVPFLTLKNPYDTVSHYILLRKLEAYVIKNNVIRLIKSYLSDRKQYVQYLDGNQMLRVSYMEFPKALY